MLGSFLTIDNFVNYKNSEQIEVNRHKMTIKRFRNHDLHVILQRKHSKSITSIPVKFDTYISEKNGSIIKTKIYGKT